MIKTTACFSGMNVYSRKVRIHQQHSFGFSSSIVKCLASENGYGSPPDDDDAHETAKRRSPWDDVFAQDSDSEGCLEYDSQPSRVYSLSSNETPKTLSKRQRSQSKSCVVEKTAQLLSLPLARCPYDPIALVRSSCRPQLPFAFL